MIRHAWSVLCEKHIIDSETNNLSLDVIEQLSGTILATQDAESHQVLLPVTLRLVSLWYRLEAEKESGLARVIAIGPSNETLGQFDVSIELEQMRARTISIFNGVPYVGPGIYFYSIVLESGGAFNEVARLPFELRVDAIIKPA